MLWNRTWNKIDILTRWDKWVEWEAVLTALFPALKLLWYVSKAFQPICIQCCPVRGIYCVWKFCFLNSQLLHDWLCPGQGREVWIWQTDTPWKRSMACPDYLFSCCSQSFMRRCEKGLQFQIWCKSAFDQVKGIDTCPSPYYLLTLIFPCILLTKWSSSSQWG